MPYTVHLVTDATSPHWVSALIRISSNAENPTLIIDWCRWDACFIRLLDGLLQAGALNNTVDASLRVPTAIRCLEILNPAPAVPAGAEGGLPSWNEAAYGLHVLCMQRWSDPALGKTG